MIERTLMAVSALKRATDGVSAPYLKAIVGVSLLALETAQTVKTNRHQCELLLETLTEVLSNLTTLLEGDFVELSPSTIDECLRLLETLQKLEAYLRSQQDVGRFRRLFKQHQSTTQLEECKAGLAAAAYFFKMNSFVALAGYEATTQAHQQEILKIIERNSSSLSFSKYSFVSGTSTLSLLLPPAPQIFHGREAEIQHALELLMQDSPNVVILGPGGIGKTAMAKTLMHDPTVLAKYPQRYFVACDSARTANDVAFALTVALGLEVASKPGAGVVRHLRAQPGALVVLDNFETPWEDETTRGAVEDFLVSVAELPQVGLMVTMRGQERPSKVKWSRPFLPPLSPLSADHALAAFIDIADPDDETSSEDISKLLAVTGNVPLAVNLMAAVASTGGCAAVLERWSAENVALLSEGEDKDNSLTASIRVSLSSPRLQSTPGALELLSILSLLPDGLVESDLQPGIIPIERPLAAKIALLRTALAYQEAGRVKVLAPVREAIALLHPPRYLSLLRPLRVHWECLFRPWRDLNRELKTDIRRLFADMGNYKSVLQYGLTSLESENRTEIKEIVYALFALDSFYGTLGIGILSPEIADHVDRLDEDDLRMRYLFRQLVLTKVTAETESYITQALEFARNAQDIAAESEVYREAARHSMRVGKIEEARERSALACDAARRIPSYETSKAWQRALVFRAKILCYFGRASEARDDADQAVWIAQQNGDFINEFHALEESAVAYIELGDFPSATEKLERVRQLLRALGLEETQHDIAALDVLADAYLHQTAYIDAREVHRRIADMAGAQKRGQALFHANSMQEVVGLDVELGRYDTEKEVVAALKPAQEIFDDHGYKYAEPMRHLIFGNLFSRTRRFKEAEQCYQRCFQLRHNPSPSFAVLRLVKMADLTLKTAPATTIRWAVVLLSYSKVKSSVPGIPWALLYLARAMKQDADAESASALLHVALEEFGRMGIYRGRAECLLELSDEWDLEKRAEARDLLLRCGLKDV
ncbi:AAA domain-containing protein [Mycena kentingensis (nom. inval.)]|nr:AAA domain-containing protein [Mycena kentingensis (nom. inval.)]